MESQIALPETMRQADVTENIQQLTFILFRPSSLFTDDDEMEGNEFREELFSKTNGKWCSEKVEPEKLHSLEYEQLAKPFIHSDFPAVILRQ